MKDYRGNARVLHAILDDKARTLGAKVFARHGDRTVTYGELSLQSARVASFLIDILGVVKDDKVAVMLPNCLAYLSAQFGISKAGAVMVPVNVLAQSDLLAHFLNHSDARVLVIDASYLSALAQIADAVPNVRTLLLHGQSGTDIASLAPRFEVINYEALLAGPTLDRDEIAVDWTDPVDIFYTSGTTGVSKGVVLPHNHHYTFGVTIVQAGRLGPDDVMYIALPLYHGAGSYMSIMPMLLCEGSLAIGDGFSARNWLDDIRRYGATATWAVNSIAPILLKQPPKPDDADNPLRVYFYIGMPPDVVEPFEKRFGIKAIDTYGSTESGHLAYTIWEERRTGSVGPINTAHYDVKIVDDNDEEVPVGEAGECVSRNKQPFTQMIGYYRMPEETLKTMRNRWLHSGDLCRVDADGWLYFLGRGKDTIRRRGENISCYELESMLAAHEGILECASIPVPSELGEDEVKIIVAPRPGRDLTFPEIMRFCEDKLPKFMIPRYIELVAEVAKLPNHKIDKQRLKKDGLTPRTWDALRGDYLSATGA